MRPTRPSWPTQENQPVDSLETEEQRPMLKGDAGSSQPLQAEHASAQLECPAHGKRKQVFAVSIALLAIELETEEERLSTDTLQVIASGPHYEPRLPRTVSTSNGMHRCK